MLIASRENKIFKTAMLLTTSRGRRESGMFIIEGIRSVKDAFSRGAKFFCVIKKDGSVLDFECDCPIFTFAPKLFQNISQTVTPQGIMALCYMNSYTLGDISEKEKNCVVICESLQDPGNIGTIIRTAHAADCGGVILTKGCCDLYNSKIVRATMAGIFSVPIVEGIETKEAIEYLKKEGYCVCAGALSENSTEFYEASLKGKHVIVIGNEGNGVKKETLELCDKVLKIPMKSDAESLNAAVAGSVMIYEHYRQNIKNL